MTLLQTLTLWFVRMSIQIDPSARPGSFASRGYGDRDSGRDRDGGGRNFGRGISLLQ